MEAPLSPLQAEARQAAQKHGVPPALFTAQIRQESGFNPKARSKSGAIGIAQIMPATAKAWKVNPRDPKQALNAAARNMAGFIKTYKKQGLSETEAQKRALAAYNAGPKQVVYWLKTHPPKEIDVWIETLPWQETRNYLKNIMAFYVVYQYRLGQKANLDHFLEPLS